MANIMRINPSATAFSDMGLKNLPTGSWTIKEGSKSISANSENYIPLAAAENNGHTWVSGQGNYNTYNGKLIGGPHNALGEYWTSLSYKAYHIFLPQLYDWDCNQLKALSGTFTLWLEKVA